MKLSVTIENELKGSRASEIMIKEITTIVGTARLIGAHIDYYIAKMNEAEESGNPDLLNDVCVSSNNWLKREIKSLIKSLRLEINLEQQTPENS